MMVSRKSLVESNLFSFFCIHEKLLVTAFSGNAAKEMRNEREEERNGKRYIKMLNPTSFILNNFTFND